MEPRPHTAVASSPSFEAFYRTQAPFVWRSMRRLGVPAADLEDAAQDVFVVAHRKLNEFEGRSTLKTWVFGICLRVASDWRKKTTARREAPITDAPTRSHSGETAVREIAMRQARQKLAEALLQLDEDKRAVFVLFELEQLPMNEVAQAVGCPLQTAYARLYAARSAVQSWLAQTQEALP